MASVRRFDAGTAGKAERMPNGWLKVDATLSRTGIYEYRLGDGTVRREYRPESEVFKTDALSSFELVPVTDDHPPEGFLTAENTAQYQRGTVGQDIRRDGNLTRGTLLITDASLIAKVEAGKREVSLGYLCDLEMKPGEWQGQKYDAIQHGIRGNHCAVVDAGRAGPEARIRLDSADGVAIRGIHEPDGSEDLHMVKISIDGVEVEVASETAAQIIQRAISKRNDAAAKCDKCDATMECPKCGSKSVKTDAALTAEKARADALQAKLTEAEKARSDAADPKRVRESVKARVALETQAREVLGEETKIDAMEDDAIRRAVVTKVLPTFKLDGKSAEQVTIAYEVAVADAAKGALAKLRGAPVDPKDVEHKDGLTIRDEQAKLSEQAFKKPTVGVSR